MDAHCIDIFGFCVQIRAKAPPIPSVSTRLYFADEGDVLSSGNMSANSLRRLPQRCPVDGIQSAVDDLDFSYACCVQVSAPVRRYLD